MQDQQRAATEALLPGLCAPSTPEICPYRGTPLNRGATGSRARRSVGTRPPWLTAIYCGLLKQPYKQEPAIAKSEAKTPADATVELETRLKELGTDYLDIWYIHLEAQSGQQFLRRVPIWSTAYHWCQRTSNTWPCAIMLTSGIPPNLNHC